MKSASSAELKLASFTSWSLSNTVQQNFAEWRDKIANINRITSEKFLSIDCRGVNFSLWVQKHQTTEGFESRPPESSSFTSTEALTTRLSGTCHRTSNRFSLNNKLYFGVRATEITKKIKKKCKKKSLEKSKIILEKQRKNSQAKNLHKKDTFTIVESHSRALNHCFKLRWRANFQKSK